MATRTVKIVGKVISDATWTVLWDGASVASGAVVPGALNSDSTKQVLGTWTFDDSGSATLTDHTLSITVNSGLLQAGPLWFSTSGVNSSDASLGEEGISDSDDLVGVGYWRPTIHEPFGDGSDSALADRSSILINTVAPTLEGDQTTTGTDAAPTWLGWCFVVGAGDELTCTARCPAEWVAA